VRTASIAQVRRPLYKGSLDHWRAYERQLEPLKRDLAVIIAAYESNGTYGWKGEGR
jgi:hypothetical protein